MNKIILSCLFIFVLIGCSRENNENYERFYFRTDGADLAVEINGNIASGIFVVLIHGGPGGGSYDYNTGRYAESLEKKYAMLYFDQRGQGASQGAYAKKRLTLQQYADDIHNLVLFLKQRYGSEISVFLMGHSWGGTTGTYALLNTNVQNEIKGWIEAAGAHDIPLLNKEAIKMFLSIGNTEVAAGNNVEKWKEILDFASKVDTNNISNDEGTRINTFGFKAEELIAEIKTDEDAAIRSHALPNIPVFSLASVLSNILTANAIFGETEATELTDELDEIVTPTLLLWGKYDFVVPPALGFSAYERINTTEKRLVIFDYSGHSLMSNEPNLFVEEVENFVERYK
jgi:pimeloyl-ACP methyl ester carboxylesterase